MPKSWTTPIPTMGQPIMPSGGPKNAFLLKLEQVGTIKLTSKTLEVINHMHKNNTPTNIITFRRDWINTIPKDVDFNRPEYVYGYLIALYGVQSAFPCTNSMNRHNGKFVGCLRLPGFFDGCCANCAYAGGPVMDKCIKDYNPAAHQQIMAKRAGKKKAAVKKHVVFEFSSEMVHGYLEITKAFDAVMEATPDWESITIKSKNTE